MRTILIGFLMSFVSICAVAASDSEGFMNALMKNDVAAVKRLVFEKHFDVNQSLSGINETPLTLAALNGNSKILGVIAIPGVTKINHQTTNGWTALMFASRALSWGTREGKTSETDGHVKVVEMLLGMGADKNLKNSDGDTALSLAKKAKNERIVKLLK